MSTVYHPESDGASKRTNKMVIQAICVAIKQDQKGWVQMLPKIWFNIMNTVNMSTGFTPFQLQFGKSAHILLPIIPPNHNDTHESTADKITMQMQPLQLEAQDNLLTSKIKQAHQENQHCQMSFPFKIWQRVILSTTNRWCVYKSGDKPCAAKFMLCLDGPYPIMATNEWHSTVMLALPNQLRLFPVFHLSEVKPFHKNDNNLFPTWALHPPDPINIDSQQEFFIDKIVDEQWQGRRMQFLVRWHGEWPKGDIWLDKEELEECNTLDIWLAWRPDQDERGLGLDQESRIEKHNTPQLTIKIPPRMHSFSEQGGV